MDIECFFVFFVYLFTLLSKLYVQRWTGAHDSEIKSRRLCRLSQPGTPLTESQTIMLGETRKVPGTE